MPELPEVETTKNGIAPALVQSNVTAVWQNNKKKLRVPYPKLKIWESLYGKKITAVNRVGKYIVVHFQNTALSFIIHLGMSGYLRIDRKSNVRAHDHFRLVFTKKNTKRWLVFNDTRRFGAVILDEVQGKQGYFSNKNLGLDALDSSLDADYLINRTRYKNSIIKNILLDQSILAGIGNIYAAEILFLAQISPHRPSSTLKKHEWQSIITCTKEVLMKAIEQGGTTIKNFMSPLGTLGYFANSLLVYGQDGQPCIKCETTIVRVVDSQRSSFFCPECQPFKQ